MASKAEQASKPAIATEFFAECRRLGLKFSAEDCAKWAAAPDLFARVNREKTMDTKHPPQMAQLPWKISRDHFVVDAQGHFVCVSGFHHTVAGGDYIPSNLNATFIVRAVNSHDQLVAALEMLLANIEEHRGIAVTSFDAEELARAALTAAGA